MVPSTALVFPLFLLFIKVGLVNTMWGIILPGLVNPFGLYLMKTFWDSGCPNELIEAARLEGASEWQIFWRIGIPVMQNALVTVALLSFVGAWNNFFFPLIVLSQENLYPLTLGLNVWNSVGSVAGGKPVYNLIALGSLFSVLPLLTAFIVLGKYWRRGLTAGALEVERIHANPGKHRSTVRTEHRQEAFAMLHYAVASSLRGWGRKSGGSATELFGAAC